MIVSSCLVYLTHTQILQYNVDLSRPYALVSIFHSLPIIMYKNGKRRNKFKTNSQSSAAEDTVRDSDLSSDNSLKSRNPLYYCDSRGITAEEARREQKENETRRNPATANNSREVGSRSIFIRSLSRAINDWIHLVLLSEKSLLVRASIGNCMYIANNKYDTCTRAFLSRLHLVRCYNSSFAFRRCKNCGRRSVLRLLVNFSNSLSQDGEVHIRANWNITLKTVIESKNKCLATCRVGSLSMYGASKAIDSPPLLICTCV